MQNSSISVVRQRWSAIILVVRWAADSGPADQNSGLPTSAPIIHAASPIAFVIHLNKMKKQEKDESRF
jgi:hypothetical protein